MLVLFLTRLLMYGIAVAMPLVHPAVVVPYDRAGYLVWFALVPFEMLVAFLLSGAFTMQRTLLASRPPWLRPRLLLAAAAAAIVAVVAFGTGLDSSAWLVAAAGLGAFVLTMLVFGSREYGHVLAAAELFFIAYVYVKMLRFSRASATISGDASILTTIILLVSIGGFLLHGIVIYSAAFPHRVAGRAARGQDTRRGRKELALFAAVIVPLILLIAVALPPNFVEHQVAFNGLNELPPSEPQPLDDLSNGPPGGNLRSQEPNDPRDGNGGGQGNQQEQGDQSDSGGQNNQPGLEGIPANEWDQRVGEPEAPSSSEQQNDGQSGSSGGSQGGQSQGGGQGENSDQQGDGNQDSGDGDGENKQYAVMLIASGRDPVYAADAYFGVFDPVAGFSYSRDDPLNDLVTRRLFETWQNPERLPDWGRAPAEYTFYSSVDERVMPYRPAEIEPTVQQRRYHPFDLSYRVVSNITVTGPEDWSRARLLSDQERAAMASYLEIPLAEQQRVEFEGYIEEHAADAGNFFEKIDAILQSFATCQYEIGFTDDVSVSHVRDFLFETRSGDCTEFSNTAAILGRMMGIPSRVVTGYLGAKSLQTPQHQRGAAILRQSIEPLQDYPLEHLYLITTAHRHSWTQFWIPNYGWVDFETTSYAKQPPPGADANALDIVIPIIEVEEVPPLRNFVFPWRFALTVLAGLAALGLVGAYGFRYGREGWLTLRARRGDEAALRALGRLLYMRMAESGYTLKERSHTALEYAERYPEIQRFARLYTMLRYRGAYGPGERAESWTALRDHYRQLVRSFRRQGGLGGLVRRVFSLRALYY